MTWENAFGRLNVYVDGLLKLYNSPNRILPGAIVLGQEQDSYKGDFDADQSLQGNLTSVNMWDRILTEQEISELAKSCGTKGEGNVVKWSDLKDKGEGDVKLINTSQCGSGL